MNGNVIRTITIRGTQEGLDKLQTDLNKLAAAHKNVAIAAEETDKATLSLERAYKQQTLRLDEVARAQNHIARESKTAIQMQREGKIDQEQLAQRLELINQHYTRTSAGAQTYGKALQQGTGEARLARHELINLSRQIQDVGVSLSSGQAPLTVLVQQGSQIADVFASSSGTLKGFFGQAAAGAGRFLTSTTGIVTGVAAIGTGLVAAGASFEAGQRDIQKGLAGIGAASGVTRDQINKIAEATSSWSGASTSQARVAATAFAATGDIYEANVGKAAKIIDEYVRSGGDAADMTKTLGAAMQDPAKGALELNKTYGFLNASTLENIRLLQSQGKEQEAQAVLMDKLLPKVQKQAEAVSIWGRAWNFVSNMASEAAESVGKDIARVGEKMTGANLGGFSDEERLGRARERVSGLQGRIDAPRSKMQAAMPPEALQSMQEELKAAQKEVAQLEKALDKGAEAFDRLSIKALAAADSFMPLQAQIEAARQKLEDLNKYQAAGGFVSQNVLNAATLYTVQLYEQEAALNRQNQRLMEIAAKYPNMSLEVAKQLEAMNGQLQVAQSRTAAEAMVTQEYVTQVQLQNQGKTLSEAMAIAATQREIAEANVSRQIADQIHGLQQEVELSKARLANDEASVIAKQAYTNARRAGASESEATGLQQAAKEAQEQREFEKRVQAVKADEAAMDNLSSATRANTNVVLGQNQVYDALTGHILDYTDSIIFWATTMEEAIDKVGRAFDTGQFNQGGQIGAPAQQYTFQLGKSTEQRRIEAESLWGKDIEQYTHGIGLNAFQAFRPSQAYYDKIWDSFKIDPNTFTGGQNISSPTAIQQSLQNIFKLGFKDGLGPINRLVEAVQDPSTQIGLIQQTIAEIERTQAPTLARQEMINTLNSKLEQLSKSTDSLNATMQQALSPFYSQDPRTTKLGFREGVTGNPDWMTGATNSNPLVAILGAGATAPGMADGGSFVVGGGNSANDNKMAVFPVASGEQIVVNRNRESRGGGQVINIDNRIIVTGTVDDDALSKMKVSRYQQAQKMRAGMAR